MKLVEAEKEARPSYRSPKSCFAEWRHAVIAELATSPFISWCGVKLAIGGPYNPNLCGESG